MKTFADIQAGDILLRKGRRLKAEGKIIIQEWEEVTVESVTRVYYIVKGEKYRKDAHGKNFMDDFYFPGQNNVPEKATPKGEFDRIITLYKKSEGLEIVNSRLKDVENIEKRAELADKLRAVLDEIKSYSA